MPSPKGGGATGGAKDSADKQPPSSWLPSDQECLCRSSRLGSHERSGRRPDCPCL